MLFSAPPPPPVSFSRDIAPILAMHCNGCHGDSGGMSTRSYKELMQGGNLGKVVLPGNPDRSLLIHFLEGRRGPEHRMPKDSRPLPDAQIGTIRRWVEEGAKDDNLAVRRYRVVRRAVPMQIGKTTRVFCRVNTQAYLVMTMRDPRNGRVLWSDVASVKTPKEKVDAASPGQLISWDLRAGYGWPRAVTLELSVEYAASEPQRTELYATLLK